MEKAITFYLPLETDVELKITVQTRFYNGIHSDPRTLTREPTVYELRQLKAQLVKENPVTRWNTQLDYPEA